MTDLANRGSFMPAAIPAAASFEADRVSTIMTDTTQADLVVIAHPDLLECECSEGGNPCSYDIDCVMSATDVCELLTASKLYFGRRQREECMR